jgi:putative endonuclease
MLEDNTSTYYIYILQCKGKRYYTGYTTDIKRRYKEHLSGSSKSKFTRSFPPEKIAACWQIKGTKSSAMKIEAAIKRLPHDKKSKLCESAENLSETFDIELTLKNKTLIDFSGCIRIKNPLQ